MKRNAVLTSTYANGFDTRGILKARALKGAHPEPLRRLARGVALGLVGALCLPMGTASSGSIKPYQNIKQLADYQLTDKQYKCHNEIVYRESRFNRFARNGSHHGYYQMRNKLVKDAPYDVQFYYYWKYVAHRYGLDLANEDVPNYCAALHHLKRKGWQ